MINIIPKEVKEFDTKTKAYVMVQKLLMIVVCDEDPEPFEYWFEGKNMTTKAKAFVQDLNKSGIF